LRCAGGWFVGLLGSASSSLFLLCTRNLLFSPSSSSSRAGFWVEEKSGRKRDEDGISRCAVLVPSALFVADLLCTGSAFSSTFPPFPSRLLTGSHLERLRGLSIRPPSPASRFLLSFPQQRDSMECNIDATTAPTAVQTSRTTVATLSPLPRLLPRLATTPVVSGMAAVRTRYVCSLSCRRRSLPVHSQEEPSSSASKPLLLALGLVLAGVVVLAILLVVRNDQSSTTTTASGSTGGTATISKTTVENAASKTSTTKKSSTSL
jgi:hypothetical protein